MSEIDAILDDCLRRVTTDGQSVEECLRRYPAHAAELRPLVEAARRLHGLTAVTPSYACRVIGRAKLMAHAEAGRTRTPRGVQAAWRLAAAVMVLVVVMLLSTTALAQAALPGEPLYGWKLTSENLWRAVSPDTLSVDLTLAERRATELTSVDRDPRGEGRARDEFHEVLTRLEAAKDSENGPRIDKALIAHQKRLSEAGMRDRRLDDLVREKGKKQ
ncbi:MAG: hypothetical protein V1755_03285 [Chloroflexota bacterium]